MNHSSCDSSRADDVLPGLPTIDACCSEGGTLEAAASLSLIASRLWGRVVATAGAQQIWVEAAHRWWG